MSEPTTTPQVGVELWVLGPMRARVCGHPARLGAPGQRAVLARLVAAGGRVVSTDLLIEDLWAGAPPPQALGGLQAYISNLRRILEPGRSPRTPATVLVTSPPGYALRLPVDAVDAWQFERVVVDRSVRAAGLRAAALRDALDLWTGAAFEEYADAAWATPDIARLNELRHDAVEQWSAAVLVSGDPSAVIPELTDLV